MMRKRQKQRPDLYGPNWQKKASPARLAKERDGLKCVDCGKPDREVYYNELGEPCIRYLHGAHVHPLDPDYQRVKPIESKRLRARCPRCHRIYDLYWEHQAEELEHLRSLHAILLVRRLPGASHFLERRFLQVN